MNVAHAPGELERRPRAVAIGTFDGVHRRPPAVVARGARGRRSSPTVVTFHPHPREVLGYGVELLATLERRLELLAELGVEETLVVEFTPELAALAARGVRRVVRARDRSASSSSPARRSGSAPSAAATSSCSSGSGCDTRVVPLVAGHLVDGDPAAASPPATCGPQRALLGRPVEVEGTVVSGDARGGTLGFPTANLRADRSLLVPRFGIYAGAARGHRAAVSIGVNPHYGGAERRIEAFLLDYEGDLYGQRVVVELWERLRDEAVFASEAELSPRSRATSRDPRRDAPLSALETARRGRRSARLVATLGRPRTRPCAFPCAALLGRRRHIQEVEYAPQQGSEAGRNEAVRQIRDGHGLARGPDRDADRADQPASPSICGRTRRITTRGAVC